MREANLRPSSRALRAALAFAALLPALACGSSSETFVAPSPSRCDVQAQAETSAFSASGGSGTIRISANRECAWSAQSDAAWIALQAQPRGQGDGSVQFTVSANADPATRSGGLSVNDRRLSISQEGRPCGFQLSSTRETVDAAGGQRTVRVDASSTECAWSASADVPWITVVNGQTGKGNGAVLFEVAPVSGPSRTGTVTVAGQSVQVVQGIGCTYAAGVTAIHVSASGGFGEVPVIAPAGCEWAARSQVGWLAIAGGSSGNGPGVVRVSAAPTDGPERTGVIIVAGISVIVAQSSGCRVSIEPTSFAAPVAGGTNPVAVRTGTGCPWSAASNAGWISVSQTSGVGPAQMAIAVEANNGPQRSGTATVAGHTFTVNQATWSPCAWSLAPPTQQFDANGGRGSVLVAVTGPCTWTAGSTVDWITLETGGSGTGSGLVQFIVAPNSGPPRTGIIRIAAFDYLVRQGGR